MVTYEAYMYATRIPHRYLIHLFVNGIPTGIMANAWGRKRATGVMQHMTNHGNELINEYGVAATVAAEIYAQRREEAMAKVKVGDSVKLLVDIGQFKKGRVCKVVEIVDSPSFYEARGANSWDDEKYPVLVMPVRANGDNTLLGPKEAIALTRGEFGPLTEETEE